MHRTFTWTLWMVALWTSGWSLILQHNGKILYPELSSKKLPLDCHCGDFRCQTVSWYRVVSGRSEIQYLGKINQANRPTYGANVSKAKFQFSMKSNSASTLTIINLSKEDTGSYSCFLGGRNSSEVKWNSGVLLLPGVSPPTTPPPTTPKKEIKSVCVCPKKKSKDGCGPLILWPLVGLMAATAVALLCTVFYFSRLPKKCRHHFAKKRLMT